MRSTHVLVDLRAQTPPQVVRSAIFIILAFQLGNLSPILSTKASYIFSLVSYQRLEGPNRCIRNPTIEHVREEDMVLVSDSSHLIGITQVFWKLVCSPDTSPNTSRMWVVKLIFLQLVEWKEQYHLHIAKSAAQCFLS